MNYVYVCMQVSACIICGNVYIKPTYVNAANDVMWKVCVSVRMSVCLLTSSRRRVMRHLRRTQAHLLRVNGRDAGSNDGTRKKCQRLELGRVT